MQFQPVLQRTPELLQGVLATVQLGSFTIVSGLAVGILGGAGRTYGSKRLNGCIAAYVEVIRNTPLLVQLFLVFFGLPLIGVRISANEAALLGLTVNLGAYCTEIFRSGFQAIPSTQVQAGFALAMSPIQVFRHVIFLPTLKIVYPALVSQVTLSFLSTSLVSAISAVELTTVADTIESNTFRSLETYIVVTVIYITMALVLRTLLWNVYKLLFGSRRPARSSVSRTGVAAGVTP